MVENALFFVVLAFQLRLGPSEAVQLGVAFAAGTSTASIVCIALDEKIGADGAADPSCIGLRQQQVGECVVAGNTSAQ